VRRAEQRAHAQRPLRRAATGTATFGRTDIARSVWLRCCITMASREREAAGDRLAGTVPFLARFIAAPSRTCPPEWDRHAADAGASPTLPVGLGTSLVSPLVDPLARGEGVPARETPGQWPWRGDAPRPETPTKEDVKVVRGAGTDKAQGPVRNGRGWAALRPPLPNAFFCDLAGRHGIEWQVATWELNQMATVLVIA
jgi:hypothetical protein